MGYDRFPGENQDDEKREEFSYQASLLRELMGPLPFRPVSVDPGWLTPSVVALAQRIYANRSFDQLPDPGKGLEESRCRHADILAHCHERGRRQEDRGLQRGRRPSYSGRRGGLRGAAGLWICFSEEVGFAERGLGSRNDPADHQPADGPPLPRACPAGWLLPLEQHVPHPPFRLLQPASHH
jgi:hypothetical protein